MKTVKAEENTACAWITYQPKVPEAVKSFTNVDMITEFMTPEEQEEIVRYGLERMKSRAIAIGATLMLGGILGMLAEGIVFFLCFIGVRRYAGGYHADTQARCYVISFGITVGALFSSNTYQFPLRLF